MHGDVAEMEGNEPSLAPVRSAFTAVVRMLEAGRATLLLRHGSEAVLVAAAAEGIETEVASAIRVPLGEGIAGVVAERGVSLFGTVEGETFLSVPIWTDRGIEGVLNITERLHDKQYSTGDIALAMSAATHIGHLIQYSRFAMRDVVSGLPNRRAFEEALERELAFSDRTSSPFTLVFVDLDNLKMINDRYGHQKGDEVIRGVGNALHRILRPYDFAGRFGGDEFALLLTGTSESAGGVTTRVEAAIVRVAEELGVEVSGSVGIARWPDDGTTGQELVASADARMYENKRRKQ